MKPAPLSNLIIHIVMMLGSKQAFQIVPGYELRASKCSEENNGYGRNHPLCAVHSADRAFVGIHADDLCDLLIQVSQNLF